MAPSPSTTEQDPALTHVSYADDRSVYGDGDIRISSGVDLRSSTYVSVLERASPVYVNGQSSQERARLEIRLPEASVRHGAPAWRNEARAKESRAQATESRAQATESRARHEKYIPDGIKWHRPVN